MGGSGSGRRAGLGLQAGTCEQYHSIDLAWLRRKKLLNVGHGSSITWSRAGNTTGSIRIEYFGYGIRLVYRQRRHGEDWKDVNEFVPLVQTQTQFGGQRQWFQCLSCNRRCRVLYGGVFFRCRRCHRLKYDSQSEASYARACSQSHGIRKRLGQTGSLSDPFPPKPKGMHWKTYWRLRDRDEQLLNRWAEGVMKWMQRFK